LVTTITGKVLATLHGPRGDVNGAILENGTILRLGPREAASVSALLQPGQSLAARGVSTTTLLGTVMEVEAIGASPDQLVEVGPGGPGRERGQDPVIGVRLRLHLRHLVEPCACETEEEKKKPALPAERGCQHCRRLA
jgi:hypothetical protein